MSRFHRLNLSGRRWRRLRSRILDRDGWRCRKCGKAGILEVDHIQPLEDGGSDEPDNLQVLCRGCHIAKHRIPDPMRDSWREAVNELR